jgi:hypothetical protein
MGREFCKEDLETSEALMEAGLILVLVLAGLAVSALVVTWHFRRSAARLRRWAEVNGYRIIGQEYRTFWKGPFFWASSRGQAVYYVTLEDRQGARHQGWVRCGGWFFGLLSDNVEVSWDEHPVARRNG